MKKVDYLKIGKATELKGRDRKLYRAFEMLPGLLSWGTLLVLIVLSFFKPVWVAYFVIAFDVYWLLLVAYLGLLLVNAYHKLKINARINWRESCEELARDPQGPADCLAQNGVKWTELYQLIVLPTYNENIEIIRTCMQAIVDDGFPTEKMIVVLAMEERAGEKLNQERIDIVKREFGDKFGELLITIHPDGIEGELKGKGANQAWAATQVKKEIVDKKEINYERILVSIFDIDTIIKAGYFHCLCYTFLTVSEPFKASYQPVPLYHNNIWQAPFFSRVAASSNTFWQMMQQIRQEKLATYSSHSMTWKALNDIGFWSTNMVSEDSRITWHCFCYYDGNYRVEPLHYPVSMDATMDKTVWLTMKSLYKQQRRWGWGVENVPYLLFNTVKRWKTIDRRKAAGRLFVQIYGFHSWATNALIIGVIGWLPIVVGGNAFNTTVLSGNLPAVTRSLMTLAMFGLLLSAVISTLLLPKKPKQYGFGKHLIMIAQWLVVPFTIILFGAVPGLEAQTRLMLGKYMGFWVTPKSRG